MAVEARVKGGTQTNVPVAIWLACGAVQTRRGKAWVEALTELARVAGGAVAGEGASRAGDGAGAAVEAGVVGAGVDEGLADVARVVGGADAGEGVAVGVGLAGAAVEAGAVEAGVEGEAVGAGEAGRAGAEVGGGGVGAGGAVLAGAAAARVAEGGAGGARVELGAEAEALVAVGGRGAAVLARVGRARVEHLEYFSNVFYIFEIFKPFRASNLLILSKQTTALLIFFVNFSNFLKRYILLNWCKFKFYLPS